MASRVPGRALSRLLSLFWVQDVLGFIGGAGKDNTAFHSPTTDRRDCPASLGSSSSSSLRTVVPIPGSKQKIWYAMTVESTGWTWEEYQKRAKFVIGELHKAVDFHETLCDRADQVAYDLRMVGTSPETSTPTIVVKCKKEDAKALHALFDECAHQRLNCTMDSDHPRRARKTNSTPQPHFKVVIFSRDAEPVTRLAANDKEITITHRVGQPTFCGSLVRSQGRAATVGLSLQVGGVDRLLTVEHLFETHPSSPPDVRDAKSATNEATSLMIPHTTHRVQPLVSLPRSSAYLDWALIEPTAARTTAISHNKISLTPKSPSIRLESIGTELHHQETPVYMVSGVNGVRSGILLRGVSYIGSQRGKALCSVWTMVPTSGVIEKGECGSVIVDQTTFQVYGHLVGADEDLGFAYIVPLKNTIEQIKAVFNTNHVALSGITSPENEQGDGQNHDLDRPWHGRLWQRISHSECIQLGRVDLPRLFSEFAKRWDWYTLMGFFKFVLLIAISATLFRYAKYKPEVPHASMTEVSTARLERILKRDDSIPQVFPSSRFDACASKLEKIFKGQQSVLGILDDDTTLDYLYTSAVRRLSEYGYRFGYQTSPFTLTYSGELRPLSTTDNQLTVHLLFYQQDVQITAEAALAQRNSMLSPFSPPGCCL